MTSDTEEARRSIVATTAHLQEGLELSACDEEAAQAVAAGLRDAKAANTHRAYEAAWQRFQEWAAAGHRSLPAEPQTVALYLGRLAASGKAMATIELARAAISHAHAPEGDREWR